MERCARVQRSHADVPTLRRNSGVEIPQFGFSVFQIPSDDEVFVTTKLDNDRHGYDAAIGALDESLERLGVDQVDLFLARLRAMVRRNLAAHVCSRFDRATRLVADNQGVSPTELTDDDLRRELEHLHATRHNALLGGSESAFATHTGRMLALEEEFLLRFPREGAPDPARTRAGARAGSE